MTATGQPAVSYGYDGADRLTEVVQGSQVVTLEYDRAGRRTRLTLPNQVSTEYGYDAASRLTALIYRNALGPLGDLRYEYDAAGNRMAVGGSLARTLLPDPVSTAEYDAGNRQRALGDRTLTYDANGNLTAVTAPAGVTTYAWDARDRLVGLTGSAGLAASFAYDALGRRQRKTVNAAGTAFLYDGLNPVQEVSSEAGPATLLSSLGLDEFFVRTDAAGARGVLTDALGSTVALTDPAGTIATNYTYEPFGATAVSGAPSDNPFQFTGREHDGTGLYYYRARYYHPGLGRFVSEDPIGLATGEFNLYAYARNQPTLLRDPLGLWTFAIGVEVQGGLMGHGGGVGVSVVVDGHGNVGVQATVGGGGWGGPAGGSIGVERTGTSAGTIRDLTGPGGAGQISLPGIAPTVGGVAGSGYAGGTVGVAGTVGIGVGSGFITYTQCLLGCRKSTPPPELPPIVGP